MHTVVTGGAGFIGTNLVRKLVEEGDSVTVVDNLHSGSKDNLSDLFSEITFLHTTAGTLPRLDIKQPDRIIHLGIYSSSPMYKRDPTLCGKAINDAISLFNYAADHQIPVIYASSSSLYSGQKPPHHEKLEILPTDYYTETRLAIERMALTLQHMKNLNAIGLRFFSVYGPHETAKGEFANIITQFLWQLNKKEVPVIFGDGSQTRDFTSVTDILSAINLAQKHGKPGQTYNAGTGTAHSFLDAFNLLKDELDSKIEPKFVENPIKNYVPHTLSDTAKSESELNFKARTDLKTGIKNLIDTYVT